MVCGHRPRVLPLCGRPLHPSMPLCPSSCLRAICGDRAPDPLTTPALPHRDVSFRVASERERASGPSGLHLAERPSRGERGAAVGSGRGCHSLVTVSGAPSWGSVIRGGRLPAQQAGCGPGVESSSPGVCGPLGTRLKARDPGSGLPSGTSVQSRGPEVRPLSNLRSEVAQLVGVQSPAFPLPSSVTSGKSLSSVPQYPNLEHRADAPASPAFVKVGRAGLCAAL